MKEIKISKNMVCMVDDEDFDRLMKFKWTASISKWSTYAIKSTRNNNKKFVEPMHRFILGLKHLDGNIVDHIDGNGLNNQKFNLRLVNNEQNQWNRRIGKNNTSGFKNVYYSKKDKKWQARIRHDHKRKYIGEYETPEEAFEAYKRAAENYHGEFARVR